MKELFNDSDNVDISGSSSNKMEDNNHKDSASVLMDTINNNGELGKVLETSTTTRELGKVLETSNSSSSNLNTGEPGKVLETSNSSSSNNNNSSNLNNSKGSSDATTVPYITGKEEEEPVQVPKGDKKKSKRKAAGKKPVAKVLTFPEEPGSEPTTPAAKKTYRDALVAVKSTPQSGTKPVPMPSLNTTVASDTSLPFSDWEDEHLVKVDQWLHGTNNSNDSDSEIRKMLEDLRERMKNQENQIQEQEKQIMDQKKDIAVLQEKCF